jgi:hypothetical protein
MEENAMLVQHVDLDDGQREITVEVFYGKEKDGLLSAARPVHVRIERTDRGFKVLASCARCM